MLKNFDKRWINKSILSDLDNNSAALTHYIYSKKNAYKSKVDEASAVKYVKAEIEKYSSDAVIKSHVAEQALQYLLLDEAENIPFPESKSPIFTFIDLFAGIGGFRLAMQNLGGRCVFSSEWDKYSKQTYFANYGEVPFGDITLPETKSFIPDQYDVLCAGFPCQAFSIAGRRGGFEDTRGTLFFDVAEIIKRTQPKAFFLENVKGLVNHDRGKTLATILNVLRNDLGYDVPDPKVLNAKFYGVPQNRERIFIAGFRKDIDSSSFSYPEVNPTVPSIQEIIEPTEVSVKYYLSETYIETLRQHKERHAEKGNGFGYQIINNDEVANAVVCGGMGRERNLILDHRLSDFTPVTNIKGRVNREGIRKMTPREWARLQGFPDEFKIVVSDVQAYKQFGNSVAVPAVQAMAKQIIDVIK